MKIEVGKFYKTRNDLKVRIYATDGEGNDYIHGAILVEDKWCSWTWYSSGKICNHLESTRDIIEEWCDPVEFNRALLPAWANKAIAKCKNGRWYCYNSVPRKDISCFSHNSVLVIPESFAPKWEGPWEKSLLVFED